MINYKHQSTRQHMAFLFMQHFFSCISFLVLGSLSHEQEKENRCMRWVLLALPKTSSYIPLINPFTVKFSDTHATICWKGDLQTNHILTYSLYTKEFHKLIRFVVSLTTGLLFNFKVQKYVLRDYKTTIVIDN